MAGLEVEEGLEDDLEDELQDELKVFIGKANGDIDKVVMDIDKVVMDIDKVVMEIEEVREELKCAQNKKEDVKELRGELAQLREKERQLRGELAQLREKERQLRGELAQLREELTQREEKQIKGPPVKKLKYMTKKQMKIDDAKKLQLNPSGATWDIMVLANILFKWMLIFDIPKLEIVDQMQSVTVPGDQLLMLKDNSVPSSEGYSYSICYYLMCGVVEYLNNKAASKKYRVVAEPIVKQVGEDRRKDKRADHAILRLINTRTVVVLEVKLSVGKSITDSDKDSLAQLFYEARLVWSKEESIYQNILAIYGNHDVWHFFLVKNSTPQEILYHSSISELSTKSVANAINHYLQLL